VRSTILVTSFKKMLLCGVYCWDLLIGTILPNFFMDSNNEKNLEHHPETSKFLESWTKQIDFFFDFSKL
jgi:hypothetical protein